MLNHICFAASPIHLICFKEFIYQNKINKYKIYILSSVDKKVNEQLDQTINFLNLENVEQIYRYRSKYIQFIQKHKFLFKIYSLYKKSDCIFIISDFKNTILHQIRILFKKSKFVLIDDGSQIYEHYEQYFKKNMYFPWRDFNNFFGKLKFLINYGFNLNFLINTKFVLYTVYGTELNLNFKSHNKLEFISQNFNIKSKYSHSSVYFIGSKMAEQNLLTFDEEIESIVKVKNYWSKTYKNFIYIAKRTTSKKKIDLIKQKIGIEVIISDMPMELQFLNNNISKIPKIICSFGSSVDKTFPMIYKNSKSYLIIINDLKKKYKFFNNYFNLYEEIMIKSKLQKNIIKL